MPRRLAFSGGNFLQYRAYRQESAAVPYGAAPEWEHSTGDGLLGILGTGIDPTFTIAGFLRLQTGAFGDRYIWRANGNNRSLRLSADGSLELRLYGQTRNAAAGTITADTWHHVAVVRSATRLGLWVGGVEVDGGGAGSGTISGRAWQMARATGNANVDLALDEWGIWSAALDVPALYARANSYRAFGGYVYGISGRDRRWRRGFARPADPASRLRPSARSLIRPACLRQRVRVERCAPSFRTCLRRPASMPTSTATVSS